MITNSSTYYYEPRGRERADEAEFTERIEAVCTEFQRYRKTEGVEAWYLTVYYMHMRKPLVQRYSEPLLGRHGLQIEINRRLYMDEARIEKNGGYTELKSNLTRG